MNFLLFDIHSHILPAIDDGSSSLEESLELLKIMKEQGVTHILATPHFYPLEDNFSDFSDASNAAFFQLTEKIKNLDLPQVFLGCEMLYFEGIGNSETLSKLCLNNSYHLLLELTDECINEALFENIIKIRDDLGITPIIAHVERYFKAKKYRKFLKFLAEENIMVQINASSVLIPFYLRTIKRLFKLNINCVIASDAHSLEMRPPLMDSAFEAIKLRFGEECYRKLIENSEYLYEKIILQNEE